MRILVTGHRGLLGSACVRRLGLWNEVITFPGNLIDTAHFQIWLMGELPVDCIIHCAAKVGGVKANRDNPVEFLSQNLKIQNTVIETAALHGVKKLIFIGTSCLYPKYAKTPVAEDAILTGQFEPSVEAYAVAKLAGYELCKAHRQQYNRDYFTLNPCNLFGLNDNYGVSAHVIPSLIARLSQAQKLGQPCSVWGNGEAVREFMFADDAADAIGVAMTSFNGDLLNIGTGQGTSIAELVDILTDKMDISIPVVWDISQPTGIPKKTFDITKLKNLGFSPRWTLPDALSATIEDFKSNPNLRLK